ncbi:transporter, major facilitator family [Verrucomicrobiia bacterium DG1235]|nr:transporter, major facilitator family [Verrucomicrobiae bacterium DG1235]
MKFGDKVFRVGFPFGAGRAPLHYGWIVAAVGTLGMVASVPGQTVGVNVFSEKLIEALGLTRTNVSAAYFVGTAVSGLALPFAGSLFDRFGARRMIVWASFALAAALGYMSVVDRVADGVGGVLGFGESNFWIRMVSLILGFFLMRFFGQGVVMMTSRNMIGKWWVSHRGKVFSIGGIAVAVCFSLAPKVFDGMIESMGWREAWRLMAICLVPGFVFVAWLLYRDNPDECGLEVDVGKLPDAKQADDPEFRFVKEFSRSEALGTFAFWAFSLVFALQALYFTAYAFHVVDVAADAGVSKGAMLNLFVPAALLNAGVSLFVGWACDRWRLKYLLAFMAGGNAVAALGLAALDGWWLSAAVVVGFGIGGGCFGALSGVFMPRFFGLKHLGAISGFFASLIVIGSAVGPLLFSVTRGATGSYELVHWGAGVASLVLLASAFWADNPQRRLAG